jgi:hypothetical protein
MTSADTSAAAAPAPAATLTQKTAEGETSFTFHAERLDYTYADGKGTKVRREISWDVVPPHFQLKARARMNFQLARGVRIGVLLAILLAGMQLHLFTSYGLLPATVVGAAAVFGVMLWLSRRHRIEHSTLGTSAGNILILRDDRHDEIVDRILRGRRAFLGRHAQIDRQRPLRWNLQRLRWLTEHDVVTPEDFVQTQRMLLPGIAEPLLRKPPATPDRRIEQHFRNALFVFDFKPDHLVYRHRTALGNEQRENYRYRDLAEPVADVQTGSRSQWQPLITLWSGIVAFGYMVDMSGRVSAGPDLLTAFGPAIAAFALIAFGSPRLLRVVCTKLPSGILILKDKRHDAIFAELKLRRRTMLEAMIEPDPLLSSEEQAKRYGALCNLGILDATQVPQLVARAKALQAHLGLADPAPAIHGAISGEEPPHKTSPQVTLH